VIKITGTERCSHTPVGSLTSLFVVPVLIVIPLLGEEHGRRNVHRQQQRKQPTQNREQNGMTRLPKRRGDPGTETHSAPEFAERT
jgi:hypothetical protein